MNSDTESSEGSVVLDDSDHDPTYSHPRERKEDSPCNSDSSYISDHTVTPKKQAKKSNTPKSGGKVGRRPHWSEAERSALIKIALKNRQILRERATKENSARRKQAWSDVIGM